MLLLLLELRDLPSLLNSQLYFTWLVSLSLSLIYLLLFSLNLIAYSTTTAAKIDI